MNSKFSIKGIPMSYSQYQRLSFCVTNDIEQGWHPTKQDIKKLVKSDNHPSNQLKKNLDNLNKLMKRDR